MNKIIDIFSDKLIKILLIVILILVILLLFMKITGLRFNFYKKGFVKVTTEESFFSTENISKKTESPKTIEVKNSEVKEGVFLRGEHEYNWDYLEVIDINGDGKEEIINYARTASWFNSIYILTPKPDGTLGLFCEHCHFIYHGGFGKIEFVDINNDKKIEVKLWGASDGANINKDKEPEIYYFINNDFIK